MKKTTYLVIISVITIICVIAGSIIHFGEMSLGWGFPWGFPWGAGKSNNKVTSIEFDDGSVSADTVSLDEFDTAKLDLTIMDVTVEEGEEAGIHYECSKRQLIPEINVSDGVLTVKQKQSHNDINFGKTVCKMILTVPAGVKLEKFEVGTSTGDVKINDIEGQELAVFLSTGDLKMENCMFDKAEISGNTGDIKITTCNMTDIKISDNTGDIKLSDCTFGNGNEGDIIISDNTGDVLVEGIDDLKLYETDLTTDIGDITINGKTYDKKHYFEDALLSSDSENHRRFTVSTNIGDVNVSEKNK